MDRLEEKTAEINLEKRPCPICSVDRNSKLYKASTLNFEKLNQYSFSSRKDPENMHLELSMCTKCNLIFASQAPKESELISLYKSASFNRSKESVYAAKTYANLLERYIFAKLKINLSEIQLLDIGAGDGAFLKEVKELGITSITGLEPSLAPIDSADESIKPYLKNDFFKPNLFPESSFDIITCFQTIEHLYSPMLLAKTAFENLKSGGKFVVICHNRKAISARLLGTKSPIFDIEHLQLFCPQSIKTLLSNVGFSTTEVHVITNKYPLSYWLNLLPLNQHIKYNTLSILKRLKLSSLSIPLFAGNILAIGTK